MLIHKGLYLGQLRALYRPDELAALRRGLGTRSMNEQMAGMDEAGHLGGMIEGRAGHVVVMVCSELRYHSPCCSSNEQLIESSRITGRAARKDADSGNGRICGWNKSRGVFQGRLPPCALGPCVKKLCAPRRRGSAAWRCPCIRGARRCCRLRRAQSSPDAPLPPCPAPRCKNTGQARRKGPSTWHRRLAPDPAHGVSTSDLGLHALQGTGAPLASVALGRSGALNRWRAGTHRQSPGRRCCRGRVTGSHACR